jgi:hypothetical protein
LFKPLFGLFARRVRGALCRVTSLTEPRADLGNKLAAALWCNYCSNSAAGDEPKSSAEQNPAHIWHLLAEAPAQQAEGPSCDSHSARCRLRTLSHGVLNGLSSGSYRVNCVTNRINDRPHVSTNPCHHPPKQYACDHKHKGGQKTYQGQDDHRDIADDF